MLATFLGVGAPNAVAAKKTEGGSNDSSTAGAAAVATPAEASLPTTTTAEEEAAVVNNRSIFSNSSRLTTMDNGEACLEGTLLMRKGRATRHGSLMWKKRYVHLAFSNGGSISIYEEAPMSIQHQRANNQDLKRSPAKRKGLVSAVVNASKGRATSLYSRFHGHASGAMFDPTALDDLFTSKVVLYIPGTWPWTARDIENTSATFVVEIPTDDAMKGGWDVDDGDFSVVSNTNMSVSPREQSPTLSGGGPLVASSIKSAGEQQLIKDMSHARKKKKPVIRLYFKCRKGDSEKALWFEAFSQIHRLSLQTRHTHGFLAGISNGVQVRRNHRSRARDERAHEFSQDVRRLVGRGSAALNADNISVDSADGNATARVNQFWFGKHIDKESEKKEYKVLPGYAYPHRWLTLSELHEEMMLPSIHFHDLRLPLAKGGPRELGCLKIEVLQCIGMPRLDRGLTGDPDPVVYLVCGPHAFCTDVILDHTNPMWLSKSKRACIFPLYHGYARLFVGVFDDDGQRNIKDDFIGRVEVDMARLRHGSKYDVLLPLRVSTHVYQKRRCGAVRLRFTLQWHYERDVLLSYLPQKKIKFIPPMRAKLSVDTTIACGDPKAFRCVALTVHGSDMTGHFSLSKLKALLREVNFTRKNLLGPIKQEIKDTRTWVNPAISGFIFCAWMHCIYEASIAMAPGYLMFYLVLQLIRSYAIYVVEGPSQEGFVPPTFEELFDTLIKPRSATSLEPLHMHRRTGASSTTFEGSSAKIHIKTHQPRGRLLFKLLGFLPWNDEERKKRNFHLEFPYADGEVYERFAIKDCLADYREDGEVYEEDEQSAEDKFVEVMTTEEETADSIDSSGRKSKRNEGRKTGMSSRLPSSNPPSEEQKPGIDDYDDEMSDQSLSDSDSIVAEGPLHQMEDIRRKIEEGAHNLADVSPIATPANQRDQDLDWKNSQKKPIDEAMAEVGFRMHGVTWQFFNSPVYDIKNPQSRYFGEGKNPAISIRVRQNKIDVSKKLDKLLELKQYSSSNPIISKIALFVEPIIDGAFGYICGLRALFNLVAWQDPNLTFLLCILLIVLGVVCFIIPWRPVLFIAGLLFVGPQNYVIRKLKERRTTLPETPKEKKVEEKKPEEAREAFHSHKRVEGILSPKPPTEVDPLEVQHIVVPYHPLKIHRFYDWPPEQQYTTVIPAPRNDFVAAAQLEQNISDLSIDIPSSSQTKSVARAKATRYTRIHKLRGVVRDKQTPSDLEVLYEEPVENQSDAAPDDASAVVTAPLLMPKK